MLRKLRSVIVSSTVIDSGLLRVAGYEPESIVDGPGVRFTLFLQGCPHGCPSCHNPETHDIHGGSLTSYSSFMDMIKGNRLLDGVTLSGGEPFLQAGALLPFVQELSRDGYHIMAYSGYTWSALLSRRDCARVLEYIDVLVDGPYMKALRTLGEPFRGSTNQRVIDVPRSLVEGGVTLYQGQFTSRSL